MNTVAEKIMYTNDLAAIVEAKNRKELAQKSNLVTTEISDELKKGKPALDPTITEATVIERKRKRGGKYKVRVVDHQITPAPAIGYLWVWLDCDGTVDTHLQKVSGKATNEIQSFSCILPNVNGPSFIDRKLIVMAMLSIFFIP